jgi:uncharacterized membrane protein
MKLISIVTLIAAVGCGLWGGVFFAFSTFVMRGLGRLPATEGIAAMNSINVSVNNAWFMTAFLGTPLLCLIVAIAAIARWSEPGSGWLVAGSILFIAGCFLVTVVFNVPLNNALDAVTPGTTEAAKTWSDYQFAWTAWNHVRTITSLAASALLVIGLRS